MWRVAVCGVVVGALVVAGCSDTSTWAAYRSIGTTTALVTTADVRVVTERQLPSVQAGGMIAIHPVLCTEPSPDVAKALSTFSSGQFAINVSLPLSATVVTGAASGSGERATAEQLAQLTERLPTIQALRDGLYRACEAYANQAIGRNAYALILSRYGELLTTLLLAETAKGDYGHPLVTLGGVGNLGIPLPVQPAPSSGSKVSDNAGSGRVTTPAMTTDQARIVQIKASVTPNAANAAVTTRQRQPQTQSAGGGTSTPSVDPLPGVIEQMQFNYFNLNHITPLLVMCANMGDTSIPGQNQQSSAEMTGIDCHALLSAVVQSEIGFRSLTAASRRTAPRKPVAH